MSKQPWKVLLVEDDEDDFVVTRLMLLEGTSGKMQLTWAQNYELGLQQLAAESYDVILVDYLLGARNGLELIQEAISAGCQSPFILLTGQGSYETDVSAMRLGVVDYLEKSSLNPRMLERTIRYSIEHKHSQDALKKAHDELEMRVQERTRELAVANRDLLIENAERKRVEQALRISEARFHTLAETTSTAIFIVQDEKIRYANPAAKIVTGYKTEDLLKMEFWEIAHPTYQDILKQRGIASQWIENFPSRYELKLKTRQGEDRWVDISAGGIEQDGHPAWVVTAFDITDRDRAEEELKHANAELRQEIAERNRVAEALRTSEARLAEALNQEKTMRRQLVQAEKHTALSRMMASVAHELNNPIQTIQNCLFLVNQDLPSDDPLSELVGMAVSEAGRMGKLVCQLREAYRPSQAGDRDDISLCETLQMVKALIEPHLQHQNVKWEQSEPAQDYLINGSLDQIKQVFLNISLNAIEAMQPTGGKLKVKMMVEEDPRRVGIAFKDSGPGISAENISRVFDPFFTTKDTGNGLGLYICYDIIQRHNGQITIDSTPGKGAVFTVWLPLKDCP